MSSEGAARLGVGMENDLLEPCEGGTEVPPRVSGSWNMARTPGSPQLSQHLLQVQAQCHCVPSCACGSCQQQGRMGPACESLSSASQHSFGTEQTELCGKPDCTGVNWGQHNPS